jgi:tetratricopeptide (TPR) repeat protein
VDTDEGVVAVKTLVAKLRGGQILITSRVTEWGRGVRPLALDLLAEDDAVALLLESARSWRAPRADDTVQARRLAERLGCLPLALTHATAYMQHHHQSFAAYLDDFDRHFDRLLAYHDHLAIEYETELENGDKSAVAEETKAARKKFVKTVATTFFLSFDRLTPEAKAILQGAAFLAPDPIPVAMFEQCPDETMAVVNLWCEESGEVKTGQNIADAIAALARYSLIARGDGVFNIHRMEQVVLRHRVSRELSPKWIECIREVLCKYAPDETAENPKTWDVWDVLRPHAEALVSLANDDPRVQPHLSLVVALGQLYFGKALYSEGLSIEERALEIAGKIHGPASDEMADRLLGYGETLRMLGRFAEAEAAFRRSLVIRERNDGPDSTEVASVLNYVAIAVSDQGRPQEAESLQRRALAIYDAKPDSAASVDVAKTLNNLANLLYRKGDYAGAEPLYVRALEACERDLGREHPHTLTCVNNLAVRLQAKGDYAGAEPLFVRALDARERVLGPEHPNTLISVNSLAALLDERGDYAAAEPLYVRALEARERVLGREHPDTLISVNNIAALLYAKRDCAAAEPLYVRALEARERVLGREHPDTLSSVNNLASLLYARGDYAGAEHLYLRALEALERVLGPDHPNTLNSMNKLANLLEKTGRSRESMPLRLRSLEAAERKLGTEHSDVLLSRNQLGHAMRKQGRADLAEHQDRKCADTTVRIRGAADPLAIHRRNNLVLTLIMLGKLEEALQILAANWRLNAPPHANTTPRIAFLRHIIALLEAQPNTPFLGQVKALLTGPELPIANDIAVPWDIEYFIEYLHPRLEPGMAEFLIALVAALNDRAKLSDLDRFEIWRSVAAVPLDVAWPDEPQKA